MENYDRNSLQLSSTHTSTLTLQIAPPGPRYSAFLLAALSALAACNTLAIFKLTLRLRPRENGSSSDGGARAPPPPRRRTGRGHRALSADVRQGDRLQPITWPSNNEEGAYSRHGNIPLRRHDVALDDNAFR